MLWVAYLCWTSKGCWTLRSRKAATKSTTCTGFGKDRERRLDGAREGERVKQEELTDQAIDYILEGINIDRLSDWEQSFVESISDQWTRNRRLTDRQKEVLGNIWDKQP